MGQFVAAPPEMEHFAAEETQKRLRRLAMQVGRTIRFCDSNAVHDLRVAIRRFSQALIVLKPCFRSKPVKEIRRTLRKLMLLAGGVRNCDVALKLLASRAAPPAGLLDEIGTRRKDARRILSASLRRWVRRRASAEWRAALETVGEGGSLQDLTESTLARLAKRFMRRGKTAARAGASAGDLHQLRLAAKKLRYSLELVAPLYDGALAGPLEQVTCVQTQLGAINDCHTVRSMIEGYPASDAMESRLRRRQRRKTGEFRREWESAAAGDTGRRVYRQLDELRRGENDRVERKPMARSLTATRMVPRPAARA